MVRPRSDRRWLPGPRLVAGLVVFVLLLTACGAPGSAVTSEATGHLRLPDEPGAELANTEIPAGLNGESAQPTVGAPAPDFVIRYADGSRVKLSDLRGHPVLLNFWATWCGPCRLEMPDIVSAYGAHQAEGLIVIGVNVQESSAQVVEFAQEFKMLFPVVIDDGPVARAYQVRVMPSSFFIDKDGMVGVRWLGILTPSLIDKSLAAISGS